MDSYNIYSDIAQRTGGDIYIGVVGPVRTGKSTFIKKFMDKLVIPNIENEHQRDRAIDELPQSAQGRTIMTTEPKFVPNEAVEISVGDAAKMRVRMIDCVGYIVPNAMGHIEDDTPRMVSTPWFEHEIPFAQAAEIGTKKVINDHSSIGVVITTDGSITELERGDYVEAEERVINELKEINKPFIILLNTANPMSDSVSALKCEMEEKYKVTVMPVNCARLEIGDIHKILENILFEFPLSEISINMPNWMNSLKPDHWLRKELFECIKESVQNVCSIRETGNVAECICKNEHVERADVDSISLGDGRVTIEVQTNEGMFYRIISEMSGIPVENEESLINTMVNLGAVKKEYDKIESALRAVRDRGYGIVSPSIDELALDEPEIVKQGSRYGVRLRATAPSIHMIMANIETEISPIVGTEKQSEELVTYLLSEFDEDPTKIWSSNIFGKSLNELVSEGLRNKLSRMPEDAQFKLQETLQRIINEGSGGLICIIL